MSLIKETGSGIDGANSYLDATDVAQQATLHSSSIPSAKVTTLALQAAITINAMQFKGAPVYAATAFPRTGLFDSVGNEIPDNVIPEAVLQAQFWIMSYESDSENQSINAVPTLQVKREKVGPLEQEFATGTTTRVINRVNALDLPIVNALLKPFLSGGPNGAGGARCYRA